jgi:hypothetical protein
MDHDQARVVGGNMTGTDPRAIAREFAVSRRVRPDIERPVWHNSLRLPSDERFYVDEQKWREIADDYMLAMGFSDQHQRVYVLHYPDHIHILASRVSVGGEVYLGRNENLRSTAVISRLEHVHGLTITPGPKKGLDGKIAPPDVRKIKPGERRLYERLEEEPPRITLQRFVREAAQGQPTVSEFVTRLRDQGVSVRANVSPNTGTLSGFSFGLGKVAFTGKKLGENFTWPKLQKAGVRYDVKRDLDTLLAALPESDPAVIAELDEAVAQVEAEAVTTAPEPEAVLEQDRPAIAADLELSPEGQEESRRIEEEDESRVEREDWMTDGDYANAVMIGKERIVFEAELEEIQAALDKPGATIGAGAEGGGTGDVGGPKKAMLGM